MARARNIKPGFYKNEDLAECSIWARFIFPGLWMLADRDGRLEDRPKRIKAELLAFDSQDVDPLLDELQARGFLVRYQNSDGSFIQISKFSAHQTPHYSEKKSVIKPPDSWRTLGCAVDDDSNTPSELQESSEKPPLIKRGSQPPDSPNPDSPNPDCLIQVVKPPPRATDGNGTALPPLPDHPPGSIADLSNYLARRGLDAHMLQRVKSRVVMSRWIDDGITWERLDAAFTEAERTLGGEAPSSPQYLDTIIKRMAAHQGRRSIHDERAATIAALTGADRRPVERDITGLAGRVD